MVKTIYRRSFNRTWEIKINDLIVVPISFVGEHIETLQEIDIEYKEIAERQESLIQKSKSFKYSSYFYRGT